MASLECSKKLLYVFNFIFWAGGAALVGFGAWMLFDPTMVNYLVAVNISGADPLLTYAAYVFIAAGGLALLVGFFGCCGAMRESQPLIFIYILILVVIMLGEIGGGVLAFLYRNKIESHLLQSMEAQIKTEYSAGTKEKTAWDYLQQEHKCCGGNNATEYRLSKWWNDTRSEVNSTNLMIVPDSCCRPDSIQACQEDARNFPTYTASKVFYGTGCYATLESWIMKHSLIMMILGLAIGGAQIFAFIAACCVRSAMKKKPHGEQLS